MTVQLADRVKETSTTTGTGTLNLDGAANDENGNATYQTFVAGVGNGSVVPYTIRHQSAAEWEVGLGTVTDATPDTLARTVVTDSSNSGSAVNLSAGTKDVFLASTADRPRLQKSDTPGLTLSNNSADSNHDIDFSAGSRLDSSGQHDLVLPSLFTKQIDAIWAAGSAAGGLFSGTVATATWYHCFTIRKDSDGSIDCGFDTSITAVNIPSGYTAYRRLGSVLTDGVANIRPFDQQGDVFLFQNMLFETNAEQINMTSLTLSVPTGLSVLALIWAWVELINVTSANGRYIRFAPGTVASPANDTYARYAWATSENNTSSSADSSRFSMATNTSGQVSYETDSTSAMDIEIYTQGWIDPRGKD